MNLKAVPFFDNHTHTLDPAATALQPVQLASNFLHGYRDLLSKDTGEPMGISDEMKLHISNMGAVHTMVNHMAKLFNCEPSLEAVTEERNRRTSGGVPRYIQMLYQDAGIIGTVIDSGLPEDHELIRLFPCRVHRLFQMDAAIYKLLEEMDSYTALKRAFQEKLEKGIKEEGFSGVKCHLSEIHTLRVRPVKDEEAERAYAAARRKEPDAVETIYFAIFTATMLQCQELGVPIHIHTGVTGQSAITGQPGISGEIRRGQVSDMDPFLLAPFLKEPQFLNTRVVLLHCGYPWLKNAAFMAHLFPHVWVDISWTLPWVSLQMKSCFEEVIAAAPHSKIMLGSGQHGVPEIAWLASKVARTALKEVLEDAVGREFLSERQAEKTAEMILYKNAQRLYKF